MYFALTKFAVEVKENNKSGLTKLMLPIRISSKFRIIFVIVPKTFKVIICEVGILVDIRDKNTLLNLDIFCCISI